LLIFGVLGSYEKNGSMKTKISQAKNKPIKRKRVSLPSKAHEKQVTTQTGKRKKEKKKKVVVNKTTVPFTIVFPPLLPSSYAR
jgi:hypothetical protein